MLAGPQWRGSGEERGLEYVIQSEIKCRAADKNQRAYALVPHTPSNTSLDRGY
jgi:hypothetical protein